MSERRTRRILQFSMQGLLLAFVFIGGLLGFGAWWVQPYVQVKYDKNGTMRRREWVRRTLLGDV